MRILLDTHIILWRMTGDQRLSPLAVGIMDAPENSVAMSVVSIWEVAIKWPLRRGADGDMPLSATDFHSQVQRVGLAPLAVTARHAEAVERLPAVHRDPFDRLLVAKAMHEGMTFMTHETRLAAYGPHVLVV